ncbi:MAG TPA: AfsR/SARP family transcriptional regulator [Gaiellaceae bacterium]|nr:AfsR/SARP family transcriptional regulator [Gaiellaceae bacterium]
MAVAATEALSTGYRPPWLLEFRILGPLAVLSDGTPLRLGGPKQRATLAILLLEANRVVSVERLADDLYAGAPPVTAVTQVQRQVSDLRKLLGSASVIETRAPGYAIRLSADQLDLSRFERLTGHAADSLARGESGLALQLLDEALDLWSGAPLVDLGSEPFVQAAIGRLQELRLAALEQRIEAELELGRHAEIVGELRELVVAEPLREQLCGQLMLALYRSGRQAEALDAYRTTRSTLVEQIGIEPGPALQELQRAILVQDSSLDLAWRDERAGLDSTRAVLVLPNSEEELDGLLAIGERLARPSDRELLVAGLVSGERELPQAVSMLNARRRSTSAPVRVAAFTTQDRAADIARLVIAYGVDLVLLAMPEEAGADAVPRELATIYERSPADVAMLRGTTFEPSEREGVFVPFGGGLHDWAALELAAWLASGENLVLRLLGTTAVPSRRPRDASRLLADASLAVQRVVGIDAEPVIVEPTEEALLGAVEGAALIVAGISPRWQHEGLGWGGRVLIAGCPAPILLVHHGPGPGGLAPPESRTSYTWSIGRSQSASHEQ